VRVRVRVRVHVRVTINTNLHALQWQPFTLTQVLYKSGWRVNSTRTSNFCAGPVFIQLVENGGQESYRKVISRWKRKTNQTCWKVSGHILISGIGLVVILFQRHERRIEAYYCEHSTLRITSAYTWYYLLIPSRQHCWRHWRHYGVGLRC